MPQRTRVFISYSHKDREWLDRLLVHLRPLEREKKIDVWVDTKITPGVKWRTEILAAIDSAQVAVLLVSANFLASDFIVTAELPPLLRAAEEDGAKIFPLLLSPSRFARTASLKEFQAVNGSLLPPISLPKDQQEEILDSLAAEIESIISEKSVQAPPVPPIPLPQVIDSINDYNSYPLVVVDPSKPISIPKVNRHIFIHTCLTAKGFLDDDSEIIAPYDELFGPLDAPHLASEIYVVIHVPHEKELASADVSKFSAVTAICCSDPKRIASIYDNAIRHFPVLVPARFFERQERILTAAADALENAFVVAVAVPPTFLRVGHKRPEVYYQAICGIFMVPLIDLHKRLQVKNLHIRVPGVGKCTKTLLDTTKRAVSSVYPDGNRSVDILNKEISALDEIAKEIAWAVKRLYNMKEDRWISYFREPPK